LRQAGFVVPGPSACHPECVEVAAISLSLVSVLVATFSAWAAKRSAASADEANTRASRPEMTAIPRWELDGQLFIEIQFDRDLDNVRILMEKPEADHAFRAFDGFIPVQPSLYPPDGKNGVEASGTGIRAGHTYGVWPRLFGPPADMGRILLRAECTARERSWVVYADTGRFALRPA
jgi:hypothetical protein